MYLATRAQTVGGWHPGLGDWSQGVQTGEGLGIPVLGAALAHSAAATAAASGAPAAILGMAPSLAIPLIGAAIVGATIAITYLIKNSGCGQTCIETSGWANQAEPLLAQNAQAYFANPTRTRSQQQAALNNFDVVWARLQQLCGQPGTGNAGVRCISDRQAGSCKWKQTHAPRWPGEPDVGQCWDWFSGYRTPIANDAGVVEDSVSSTLESAGQTLATDLGVGSSSILPLAIAGGLLLWVALS